MEVKGVWNVRDLPGGYIIVTESGAVKYFDISPIKKIEEADLMPYTGPDPRKRRSAMPMPDYLYRFYGLDCPEAEAIYKQWAYGVTAGKAGSAKTSRKAAASAENGKKGGRPKGDGKPKPAAE
ncbi:hypothetical protein FACS1894151_10600 [Spirochaetia bacterium]|nr:hypothetical protein FACS1894151_10600 [Spirochaetia bacterium]